MEKFEQFMDTLQHSDTVKVILTGVGETEFLSEEIHKRLQVQQQLISEAIATLDEIDMLRMENKGLKAQIMLSTANNDVIRLYDGSALEGADEHIGRLEQEIDQLKRQLNCERQTVNMLKSYGLHYDEFPKIEADELIDKLVAGKDEQVGKIEQMEELLKQSKNVFEDASVSGCPYCWGVNSHDDKCNLSKLIKGIDALLGGKEDV